MFFCARKQSMSAILCAEPCPCMSKTHPQDLAGRPSVEPTAQTGTALRSDRSPVQNSKRHTNTQYVTYTLIKLVFNDQNT